MSAGSGEGFHTSMDRNLPPAGMAALGAAQEQGGVRQHVAANGAPSSITIAAWEQDWVRRRPGFAHVPGSNSGGALHKQEVE
jgi:hypothetical protein